MELLFAYYFARRDDLFRARIRTAMRAYGGAFAPAARAAATDDLHADELVHLVVSLIEGVAVSAIIAPEQFAPQRLVAVISAALATPHT